MNISGISRTQSLSFGSKEPVKNACKEYKLAVNAAKNFGQETGFYSDKEIGCQVAVEDDCLGTELHDAKRAADRGEITDLVLVKPYLSKIKH
ncbi:MAG: hypothetical protein A2Y25_09415 [Candidatus Melainabacteria bacterium GWF2_37_15]|nr:MAG: hypothetical protein A2Y25_09415 [Candidatus Melainabacteria bacterium GWF2_37_15]